jgi:hypothetical protein
MPTAALMLAAMLVLSHATQIGAAVACYGSDGHVDVEFSVCTCCIVVTPDDERSSARLISSSPSCDGCVDVLLTVSPRTSKVPQLTALQTIAKTRTLGSGCTGDSRVTLAAPGHRMDQHWHSLAPLSTVVLLN